MLALTLFLTGASKASFLDGFDKKEIYIPKDETINDDYIGAAEDVKIDGVVNGDVMTAGIMVDFSGESSKDVLAIGSELTIGGKINGNLRAIGGSIVIEGEITNNVTIAGGDIIFAKGSVVKGNVYIVGGYVEIEGKIEGNVETMGGQVLLAGDVAKNANIISDEISTGPETKIGGNLTYYSDKEFTVDKSIVGGEIIKKSPAGKKDDGIKGFLFSKMFGFFSLLLFSFVLYRLFSKNAAEVFRDLSKKENFWKYLAFGITTFIIIPIVCFILIILMVGLPLALTFFAFFAVALMFAKFMAYAMTGYFISKRFRDYKFTDKFPIAVFVIGYLILEILLAVPILGWLAVYLIVAWSFGGLTEHIYRNLKNGGKIEN